MPSPTALKAARSATSVLPYPTSPATRRSIGRPASMSCLASSIALSWSAVSSNRKAALAIADLHRLQTQIAAEPVVFVDDDVAGRQVGERRERGAALILGSP